MANILNQNIISELGIDSLEPDKQMDILGKIGQIIFQAVLIRVLALLGEEEQEKLNDIMEQNDVDALLAFLQATVPNLDEIIKEETVKFKQQSIDFASQLK